MKLHEASNLFHLQQIKLVSLFPALDSVGVGDKPKTKPNQNVLHAIEPMKWLHYLQQSCDNVSSILINAENRYTSVKRE